MKLLFPFLCDAPLGKKYQNWDQKNGWKKVMLEKNDVKLFNGTEQINILEPSAGGVQWPGKDNKKDQRTVFIDSELKGKSG